MDNLPAELYQSIVRYVPRDDLPALSRTSKALQPAAEAILYEPVMTRDAQTFFIICRSILAAEVRGSYVRRVWFQPDTRRTPRPSVEMLRLHPTFWKTLQDATKMDNLELLVLHDPVFENAWVLNSVHHKFQLREAVFGFPWETGLVAFLQTQTRLRSLQTMDAFEDGPACPLAPGKLRTLEVYNGPVLVAMELLQCPLTHVQITVDEDTAALVPTLVSDLGKVMKTLRSISILTVPEHLLLDTLQLISTSIFTPTLRHLGVIPLPVLDRNAIHRCLMRLPALKTLEVDATRWVPVPPWPMQKMVVTELHVFCPSLVRVSFWVAQQLSMWVYNYQMDRWENSSLAPRMPYSESLWRNA